MLLLASAYGSKHVLFIVSDDLGWDDCGFRNPQIKTPVIDNMASKGVVLGQYYIQPSCSPTRASFLSGRYPLHTGVNNFIPPTSSYGLPLNETTLADLMTKAGYSSHAIGKCEALFFPAVCVFIE
jgi:arylsulfatase B/arylsulfatase I/J